MQSFSTFVILSANAPIATVLYQNFPDPFPNARVSTTCIWFDLKNQSNVHIDILDLRGNHVAQITPGRGLGPDLSARAVTAGRRSGATAAATTG